MLVKMFHILFAAWMILASGGYALFEQICHCTGNTDITLTATHHCQDEDMPEASCCTEVKHCCGESSAEEQACGLDEEKGCCETERLVVLKTDVFTPATWAKISLPTENELAGLSSPLPSLTLVVEKELIITPAHGPPRLPDNRHHLLLFTGAFHASLS
jgi:hypothetical protein